jgi:mannose-1-phosphate guanylyltransferase
MILPVILAGGTGTRLWPLSRELYPKQFLALAGEQSMLQQTLARLSGIEHAPPLIICNEEHRFIVAEQLRHAEVEHSGIILEPSARNTAPAITLAAIQALQQLSNQQPLSTAVTDITLLVLAADHLIADVVEFHQSIDKALALANKSKLVTFGIKPDSAQTGYGYIQAGAAIDAGFTINQFVEKPDKHSAQRFIDEGTYYWNSGMFMFQAQHFLAELEQFKPEIVSHCRTALQKATTDFDFIRVDKAAFEQCPSDSIDYALMEHTKAAVMVALDAHWHDIGSWQAMWQVSAKDEHQNAIVGDVIAIDANNNYLHSEHQLIGAIGVDNLVIVATKDSVLVAQKDRAQDVKKLVEHLKSNGRQEHRIHSEVYRPWGKYDVISTGLVKTEAANTTTDKVKRISVKPGAKLSLQKHQHRCEHWIVVSGIAKVTRGDEVYIVAENESTYIPKGTLHALENPGNIALEMIEVQTGSYLEEDDIERFDDRYGRS